MSSKPSGSDAAIYEDARHWANLAMWSIRLQIHRLCAGKTELPDFIMQDVADLHFLLISIGRLRKAADLASTVSDIDHDLRAFDAAVPWWRKCRNVMEHIGEYRSGAGRDASVSSGQLQVFLGGGDHIEWIGERIEFGPTLAASERLFRAIQGVWPEGLRGEV